VPFPTITGLFWAVRLASTLLAVQGNPRFPNRERLFWNTMLFVMRHAQGLTPVLEINTREFSLSSVPSRKALRQSPLEAIVAMAPFRIQDPIPCKQMRHQPPRASTRWRYHGAANVVSEITMKVEDSSFE